MIAIGQILFPWQANGSLITNNQGQVVGSALIGQPFTSDRYFNSRPSTTAYSTANPKNNPNKILQTGILGASNLAPSNPVLIDRIKGKPDPDPAKAIEGRFRLEKAGIKPTQPLVYTSGSSLRSHITPAAARAQIEQVASRVRGLQPNQVESLIIKNTGDRFLGIFGEPGVNVLKLNLALDTIGNDTDQPLKCGKSKILVLLSC
jgi:K+-transporting ATPase ATPase C chain